MQLGSPTIPDLQTLIIALEIKEMLSSDRKSTSGHARQVKIFTKLRMLVRMWWIPLIGQSPIEMTPKKIS
jgi:hypothetical protein